MIVRFSSAALPNRAELGGKAASLIRMTNAGLPVPGGAVLTTVFFAPWFEVIKASAMWAQLVESTPERWEPLCCALKDSILSLPLAINQRDALDGLRREIGRASCRERVCKYV